MDCLKQRSLVKVTSPHSIPYAMLFLVILGLYDHESSLNLNRLALYAIGEEITKGTINKMIVDQLFPCMKEEPFLDIVGDSYRVRSQIDPQR